MIAEDVSQGDIFEVSYKLPLFVENYTLNMINNELLSVRTLLALYCGGGCVMWVLVCRYVAWVYVSVLGILDVLCGGLGVLCGDSGCIMWGLLVYYVGTVGTIGILCIMWGLCVVWALYMIV